MKVVLLSLNWVEYLIEMANALAARGHHVDIIVKSDRVRETVGDQLPALLSPAVTAHLIDDRPRGLRDPRQLATILRLIRLLRRLRPDVLNLHEATQTYLPLCLRLATRAPLVLTVHDVTTHPGEDSQEPPRRARVREQLRRRASSVILHGEWLRQRYLRVTGLDAGKVFSIPHGCYTVFRYGIDDDVAEVGRSVLFFGRINRYKGLGDLLRACEAVAPRVEGFRLVIAGRGGDLEHHRRAIADSGYCELHEGYLSNLEVARLFQQASLVVLPYIEGSQSGVVRIAYVFGKPVVVTDVGSIPEAVQDGVTGRVVPPGDTEALAQAMIEILGDDARRREMARAAAEMPRGELSWASIAERTERVFQRVVG
ncbi:MAG: glycosyltransferase family 4 protein [Acidobacteriota bacterium]